MKALGAVLLVAGTALAVSAAAVLALGDRSVLVPPPEAKVESFVRQLVTGRFERAMPHLSANARPRARPESLEAGFHALEARIGRVRDVTGRPLAVRGDTAWAEAVLEAERASRLPLAFRLVREHGVWAVDGLGDLDLPEPLPRPRPAGAPAPAPAASPRGAGRPDSAQGS